MDLNQIVVNFTYYQIHKELFRTITRPSLRNTLRVVSNLVFPLHIPIVKEKKNKKASLWEKYRATLNCDHNPHPL